MSFVFVVSDKLLSTGLPVWYESQSVKETGVLVVNALVLYEMILASLSSHVLVLGVDYRSQ